MNRVALGLVVLLVVLTAAACKGPTAPSATPAPPPDPTRPASILLDFTTGIRSAAVRAYVRNDAMAMLPDVVVTFSTNLGALSTEKATTNDKGVAETTVNGEPGSAKVTASVGTLTGSTLVVLQSAPPPLPPDVPQPPPPPIPPPPPPPTPVAGYLVGLVAAPTPALIGIPVTFTATATPVNGAPAATSYAWTFGDGSPLLTTPTASTTYPYASAATFTVRVTATGGTAVGTAFTSVTVVAAIPVVSVNCSTGVHLTTPRTPSTCVAAATLGGVGVPSSDITSVTWDFGDGPPPIIGAGNVSPPHNYPTSASYIVFATATVTGATGPGTGSGTTTILP